MSKWEDKKDILERLILIEKLSYEEIGERFGCCGNNIKKVAKKLGIEILNRRKINKKETFKCCNCGNEFILKGSKGKFCCTNCSNEYKHKKKLSKNNRW